jgi:hypothetical protein
MYTFRSTENLNNRLWETLLTRSFAVNMKTQYAFFVQNKFKHIQVIRKMSAAYKCYRLNIIRISNKLKFPVQLLKFF